MADDGIVGMYGVVVRNESCDRSLEMRSEQELVVGNSLFRINNVYKYTWMRMMEGR